MKVKKSQKLYKVDEGENHWGYMAELYLSDPIFKKVIDKKYGSDSSKFIGEALKFYSENSNL